MVHRFLSLLCCLILLSCGAIAQQRSGKIDLAFSAVDFKESFHWSIAGNYAGQNPNILSELKWKNLLLAGGEMKVTIHPFRRMEISATGLYALHYSGTVEDADYKGNDRSQQSYSGNFSGKRGSLASAIAGIKYTVTKSNRVTVKAGINFLYARELFSLQEGAYDSLLIEKGLNSTYDFTLWGTGPALYICLPFYKKYRWESAIEDYLTLYNAQANWNLVSYFNHPKSFSHSSSGNQLCVSSKIYRQVTDHLAIYFSVSWKEMYSKGGTDALYLKDGSTLISHFNGAGENCIGGALGVAWTWN